MTNKLKKRVRALAERAGMSYQAAHNTLQASGPGPLSPSPGALSRLLIHDDLSHGAAPVYAKDEGVLAYVLNEEGDHIYAVSKPRHVVVPWMADKGAEDIEQKVGALFEACALNLEPESLASARARMDFLDAIVVNAADGDRARAKAEGIKVIESSVPLGTNTALAVASGLCGVCARKQGFVALIVGHNAGTIVSLDILGKSVPKADVPAEDIAEIGDMIRAASQDPAYSMFVSFDREVPLDQKGKLAGRRSEILRALTASLDSCIAQDAEFRDSVLKGGQPVQFEANLAVKFDNGTQIRSRPVLVLDKPSEPSIADLQAEYVAPPGENLLTKQVALPVLALSEEERERFRVQFEESWTRVAESMREPLTETRLRSREELQAWFELWRGASKALWRRSKPRERLCGVEFGSRVVWFSLTLLKVVGKDFGEWYLALPEGETVFDDPVMPSR